MQLLRMIRLGSLVVACAAVGCARLRSSSLIGPGSTAPPLEAVAWINGPPPDADSLAGKVVVVDVWAFW